ncbi:MAG: hypothetical protein U0R49_08400 [Fimbriimonadales bacterium]
MKRVFWVIAAVLIALVLASYFTRNTFKLYKEQEQIAKQSEQQLRKAELERAKLITEKARLENPVGQEEMARKMGYRKPNERDLASGR